MEGVFKISEVIVLSFIIIMVMFILFTARFFYLYNIRMTTKRILSRINIHPSELNFALEKLVFFESLTSHHPIINQVKKENIIIKHDYDSLLFQQINGLKVLIKGEKETILLAYLTVDDFRLPLLDLLQYEGILNDTQHRIISINQLTLLETVYEIKTEIYARLQQNKTV